MVELSLPDSQMIIDGRRVSAGGGETFATVNPATERTIAHVAQAGPADVDAAVRSARAALHGPWRRFTGAERGPPAHSTRSLDGA